MPSDHACEQSAWHKITSGSIETCQVLGVQLLGRHEAVVAWLGYWT